MTYKVQVKQARSQTRAHPGSARVAQNIARVAKSPRLPG